MMTIVEASSLNLATCLTFEQLRAKVSNHLKSLPDIKIRNFNRPDVGMFREELGNVIEDLQASGIAFEGQDLTDAFYSTVFEIEHGRVFLPNALIAPKDNVFVSAGKIQICRLRRFSHNYPFVAVSFYKQDGSFELGKTVMSHKLTDFILVLSTDPLIKGRGK